MPTPGDVEAQLEGKRAKVGPEHVQAEGAKGTAKAAEGQDITRTRVRKIL